MKQKVISLTLCLSILLSSMGQMFAVQTEQSDTQTYGHTAEVLSELQQAKEEAEEEESDYDLIEVDGIDYVRVDENCEPIEKGDSTEPAGVAVYVCDLNSETITIPSAVTIPDTEQELPVIAIDDYAFVFNETMTGIKLPETIQVIGEGAFGACTVLKSITIPNGVKKIEDLAFAFCEALERVSISGSVEEIGLGDSETFVFMGCISLTDITVEEDNANYSASDNILYNKDKTALLFCPAGRSGALEIPSGVTEIGDGALAECELLTSVTLPNTVKIIGVCAFSICSGLTTLSIPAGVEKIDDYAFEWCDGLTTIRFAGDMPEFGVDVFDQVTAKAYYPISWTEVPSADEVGGDITWIPDIPTVGSLKAASASYNSAKISWGKVSGVDGYVVYRQKGSSWKRLGTTTSTSYTDKNLTCGTTYTYTVRAYKMVGGSEVKGGYDAKGVSVKVVPQTVKLGTATASGSSIKVTWNTVSGANGYTIYRKTPGASKWKNLKSVGSSTTSYTDKNLNAGKYIYTVRAYRTVSNSKVLGGYDANGVSASIAPAAPKLSGLSGSANSITVKWDKITGADGYRVYRKTGSGKWKKLKEITDGSTVTYKDTAAEGGATYTYTVRAFIKDGDEIILSSYDEKGLSVTIAEQPVLVGAAAKVSSNQMSVTVTWEQAKNAKGYVVYRLGDNDTKWRKLATISGGSTTSYKDSKPEGGVNYAYTVRAYTTAGKTQILSTYDTVGVSAFIPAQPTLKSAAVTADDTITVKWDAVANADGYRVYRKSNKSTKWATVATIKDNSTVSYVDEELENGLKYTYTVRAYVTTDGKTLLGTYDETGVSTYYMEAPEIELYYDYEEGDLYIFWTEVETADGYVLYGKKPGASKWSRDAKVKNSEIVREDGVCGIVYEDFDIGEQEYLITIRPYKTISGKEVLGSYLRDGVSTYDAEDIEELF